MKKLSKFFVFHIKLKVKTILFLANGLNEQEKTATIKKLIDTYLEMIKKFVLLLPDLVEVSNVFKDNFKFQ